MHEDNSSDYDSENEQKELESSEEEQVLIPASKFIGWLGMQWVVVVLTILTFSTFTLLLFSTEDPAEQVFDDNMDNINMFMTNIAKFEEGTNNQITDLWRIKDMAF